MRTATAPKTVLYLFVGAHVFNDLYVTALPAFLPALADEFGLDYSELGLLSFAFTILGGLLQPLIGNYADREGRRRFVIAIGFAIGAAGFLGMALSPSFWLIVVLSALCGLGGATYHPQATAFLVRSFPSDRGRTLGIHGWGGSIGHFLAPLVVTLAIAAFNWRLAMLVVALPLLVVAFVLHSRLEETQPHPKASLRGAMSRELLLVAVAFGLMAIVQRSFITFTVAMLVDEGWAETSAGTALTVILLAGAIAQPTAGRLFDKVGGRSVFLLCNVGTVLSIGLFIVSNGGLSLFAIGAVATFGFAPFPVALALASQLASEEHTGGAVGVIFGVSGLMAAAGQPLVGVIGEAAGDIRVALGWLIVVALISVPFAFTLGNDHVASDS